METKTKSNVERLHSPPHEKMSVRECLTKALGRVDDYKNVMVVGYDKDDELCVSTSGILRKDALWILDHAKDHVRRG